MSMIKPHAVFLRREWVALNHAVIIRVLNGLVPVSGTWLAEPETLERSKASKLGRWKSTGYHGECGPPPSSLGINVMMIVTRIESLPICHFRTGGG